MITNVSVVGMTLKERVKLVFTKKVFVIVEQNEEGQRINLTVSKKVANNSHQQLAIQEAARAMVQKQMEDQAASQAVVEQQAAAPTNREARRNAKRS